MSQLCIDNQPTRSSQTFKIKAKIRVNTKSCLKDFIITDYLDTPDQALDIQLICEEKIIEKKPQNTSLAPSNYTKLPLHLVFLVDSSDSFNKLDEGNSNAGQFFMDKFVGDFLRKGHFYARKQPTTVTCIQFSGMGSDILYKPGTKGVVVEGANIFHYKIEIKTRNFAELTKQQTDRRIRKLENIKTIDGNGQLYLVLQDISMKSFHDKLDMAAGVPSGTKSSKYLIIITDDEWDFNNLQLSSEIPQKERMTTQEKKKAIINFARSKYDEIHTCIIKDYTDPSNFGKIGRKSLRDIKFNEFIDAFGPNTNPIPRQSISAFDRDPRIPEAKAVCDVLDNLKKNLYDKHQLAFNK